MKSNLHTVALASFAFLRPFTSDRTLRVIAWIALVVTAILGAYVVPATTRQTARNYTSCDSMRKRFTDTITHYRDVGVAERDHARHQHDAADYWRSHAALPIALTWENLADDSDIAAVADEVYQRQLTSDFDTTCGTAPTPRPYIKPTPLARVRAKSIPTLHP